ncbi:hypothetical protein H9P43_006860 [Blastocladiella emersonii ATCC 22665]|nr:hypothetical protein H9P43_006860 [Blastocladiella emersonii ATCC 22665]
MARSTELDVFSDPRQRLESQALLMEHARAQIASSQDHRGWVINTWREILSRATVDQIQQLIDVVTPASDFDMASAVPRDMHPYGVNGHALSMELVIELVTAGDASRIAEFASKVTTLRGQPWAMSCELAKRIVRGYCADERVALLRGMWDGPVLADQAVRRVLVQLAHRSDKAVFRDWAREVEATI